MGGIGTKHWGFNTSLCSLLGIPCCLAAACQVDEFMPCLPVITGLRTAGMRDRHWDQLSDQLGVNLHPDESYTLTM